MPLGALISGGFGLVSGLLNRQSQKEANAANLQAVRETNLMNYGLTRAAWARDDNAVQRRVEDLKAAGLSPTLAAGSPAGVSQPIKMGASQVESERSGDSIMAALQGMQMSADYSMTRAQTALINQQKKHDEQKMQQEYDLNEAHIQEAWTRINNMSTRTQIDQYDFEFAKRIGVPTDHIPQFVGFVQGLEYELKRAGVNVTANAIVTKVLDKLDHLWTDKPGPLSNFPGIAGLIDIPGVDESNVDAAVIPHVSRGVAKVLEFLGFEIDKSDPDPGKWRIIK